MATVKLPLGELPFRITKDAEKLTRVVKDATRKAAEQSRRLLKSRTPVDQGEAKNAWQVRDDGNGYSIYNDCPYIMFLNDGTRPHPVSQEGQELILAWVYRHFEVDEKAAKSIVWAIVTKIKNEGSKGVHFLEKSADEIMAFLDIAIKEAIRSI